MTVLHVCTAFDKDFVIPSNIMMRSVIVNSDHPIHFHLLVPADQFRSGVQFLAESTRKKNVNFSIYPVDDSTFDDNLQMHEILHFSNAALYRLFMTEYLPITIDKVLYLDGDLVINLDIGEIFAAHYNQIFAARIEDTFRKYFNSGVFITSLGYWRKNDVKRKCLEFLMQNPKSRYKDQDSLNHVFSELNSSLNRKFNFPVSQYSILKDSNHHRSIFHFTGTVKPWKNHAPSIFPVNLWRKTYFNVYGNQIELNKVKMHVIKKIVITIKSLL